MKRLSHRQRQVLALIEQGHDTEGIARALGISKWTTRDHVRRLSRELDCPMAELPKAARNAGVRF